MRLKLASVLALGLTMPAASQTPDWKAVEAAMGRSGTAQANDVYRFNFPRSDLRVMVGGLRLRPAFALGSWVAMHPVSGGLHGPAVMAMGDLVLTERELAPVMDRLLKGGIEITAIHHHVIRETPRILYMHIHAVSDPVDIAKQVRDAIALTKTPPATPSPAATSIALDTAAISRILGQPGRVNGGVYQVSVARADTIRERDMEIQPTLGLATAINFQPTGSGKAAIIGDFVMRANEVDPVMRALRANGIQATSLHSHLLNEEPRLYFMHFWANEDAMKLARGLREALDKTNSKRQVATQ
jgi:Domain of Unknown Function (DUF1259)